MTATPAPDTAVVLLIGQHQVRLLRAPQGVGVEIVSYDLVEEHLELAVPGDPPLPTDSAGARYVSFSPPPLCEACSDWIGDDEPRVSLGHGSYAASYCMPCVSTSPGLIAPAPEAPR